MCKGNDTTSTAIGWKQVVLPFLAGLAHLHVVYFAVIETILPIFQGQVSGKTTEDFAMRIYLLDRAVFIAYVVDLIGCFFKALPFSRCNRSKDIIEHHLPTLLMALPFAVPTWAGIGSIEPSLGILELGAESDVRDTFMKGIMMASGFAYISSLNEVFMCFQRVEMSLQGVATFVDIPKMKTRIFTSRLMIGTELCYKLTYFWGLSILACKGCSDVPYAVYQFHASNEGKALWQVIVSLFFSPIVLRALLFLTFSVVMYPSMGKRSLRKIKQLFGEGQVKRRV